MKFQLPYEILKLFDRELAEDEANYAPFIQDNFDAIVKYFNDLISGGNIKLDADTGDYIEVKDASGIVRVKIGKIGTKYGVAIYDTSGNILANLYDSTAFEIKKAVKIEPAWDGGWAATPASGNYITRTHSLGYFPSSMQLFGGDSASSPTYIYDESYYASMDITWCSKTQVRMYFLDNASHGLPVGYRIVLFK